MQYITSHTSHVTRHTSHVTRHTSHITHHLGWVCSMRVAVSRPLFTKQPSHDSDMTGYAVDGDDDGDDDGGGGDDDASAAGC